jgi:hypothetical protein
MKERGKPDVSPTTVEAALAEMLKAGQIKK